MSDDKGDEVEREFRAHLDEVEASYAAGFAGAKDEPALRQINAAYVRSLNAAMKLMPKLGKDQRRDLGRAANALKQALGEGFDAKLRALHDAARQAELSGPRIDLSLPGRAVPPGRVHPITRAMHDLLDVFLSLGFEVADAPEIDLADHNFRMLGFPPDHPATDMQDSFFIQDAEGGVDEGVVLRTHTSTVQIHQMKSRKPPLAVVCPGAVYRRDDDATHSPMFAQLDGFAVDEGLSVAHLKGIMRRFLTRLFGESTPVRFRPSYFPFVEPGGEVDIGCVFCRAWEEGGEERRSACAICKGTGWLEILGCGMIHPVVLENVGIDPERYSGYAFGMGLDRIAMLRHGVPNIRLLYENDVRFLAQL